jgi:hypothetical protein
LVRRATLFILFLYLYLVVQSFCACFVVLDMLSPPVICSYFYHKLLYNPFQLASFFNKCYRCPPPPPPPHPAAKVFSAWSESAPAPLPALWLARSPIIGAKVADWSDQPIIGAKPEDWTGSANNWRQDAGFLSLPFHFPPLSICFWIWWIQLTLNLNHSLNN